MDVELERCDASFEPFDFMSLPYASPVPPAGKLTPATLFRATVAAGGGASESSAANGLIARLRERMGRYPTVWGAKLVGGRFEWELYFCRQYDRSALAPSRVLSALQPRLDRGWECLDVVDEEKPYIMYSVDLPRPSEVEPRLNIYFTERAFTSPRALPESVWDRLRREVGENGSPRTFVVRDLDFHLFVVENGTVRHANLYQCIGRDRERLEAWLSANPHVIGAASAEAVLFDEFPEAVGIFLALKPEAAGLYYCRVDVDSLLRFMQRMAWPRALVEFARAHREELDHLLFDIGFDFHLHEGRLEVAKSGVWSTL